MKKAFVIVISIVLLVAMTTACGVKRDDSVYNTLSADDKAKVGRIVNSSALSNADGVYLIQHEGTEYLVVHKITTSSDRAFNFDTSFYPIYETYVGNVVSDPEIHLLNNKVMGMKWVSWNPSATLAERQEIIAKLVD